MFTKQCPKCQKQFKTWFEQQVCCSKSCARVTHGGHAKKLYRVWVGMNRRCSDKGRPQERRLYYDIGIRVCAEWKSYPAFEAWAIKAGYREGLSIDRINGDKNYCPENCRWTTSTGQNRNKRVRNDRKGACASKFKGVAWCQGKWAASICCDYKSTYLGRFSSEEAAARAYNEAAIRLFGEYAHLNVIPEARPIGPK